MSNRNARETPPEALVTLPRHVDVYNDRDVDLVAAKWVAQRNHNGLYSHLKPAADVFRERMKQAVLTQLRPEEAGSRGP